MSNREIKFRAWDGREMREEFSVQANGDGANCAGDIIPHWVLMQYTGMTDKNGVEIYEGDIIRLCNNDNGYFTVEFSNSYVGGWILTYENEPNLSLGARKTKDLEVIGNIHENPDLTS